MHPKQIKEAFARGENISSMLKLASMEIQNSEEIIETAYDLQAGSYVDALRAGDMHAHKVAYGRAIAAEVGALTVPGSIMEAGIGEGTTFSFVLTELGHSVGYAHGFDLSWSRIACCRDWLRQNSCTGSFLSVASLLHTPYADSSFDVVYTSHTIEPNGGNEEAILRELYRITSRYLILLEPGYELASKESRARMDQHGYCKNLVGHAEALEMRVTKHELFGHSANPLNPTAITIIEKNAVAEATVPKLACPLFGDPLVESDDSLYSAESLRAYPKIKGIPCLRVSDGIIASGYGKFAGD